MAIARRLTLGVAVTIGLTSAPLQAQSVPATAPTKAQLDNAALVLRIITSALQSPSLEQPVKNALFQCVYSNPVSKISEATDKIIAANAGKVDRKDPSQMLVAVAGVCGYRPAPAPAKPAPKSAPKN